MSPEEVDEWPAQLVEDALERMVAEGEWHTEQDAARRRQAAYRERGGVSLDDGFPELEG